MSTAGLHRLRLLEDVAFDKYAHPREPCHGGKYEPDNPLKIHRYGHSVLLPHYGGVVLPWRIISRRGGFVPRQRETMTKDPDLKRQSPAKLAAGRDRRYTIADLEGATGVSARTIRYYITEGLLPSAHGRGPTATYDLGHLLRLRMALALRDDERLGIAPIRERLSTLSDDDIAALLDIQTRPPADRWRRISLHPSLELHVREPAGDPDIAVEEAVGAILDLVAPVVARLGVRR